ncbi:hypothetical protein ACFL04_01115 [Patescibacteria group bacterium]
MGIRTFSLFSLVVLLFLELFLDYDNLERKLALISTNVIGVLLYLGINSYFKKRNTHLPSWLWLLVAAGIWFDAAGNFAHLYGRYGWWDQLVHVVGPAMVAAIFVYIFAGFQQKGELNLSKFWHNFIVISSAMLLTVLYEITEYVGDILFNTNRITNLLDTADDLWWGLLAIVIVVTVLNKKIYYKKFVDR